MPILYFIIKYNFIRNHEIVFVEIRFYMIWTTTKNIISNTYTK